MIKLTMPDINGLVEHLTKEVHLRVSRRTPVKSGAARDGWEVRIDGSSSVINNDVPYIGVLEEGNSTHKANNMVRTTMEEVPSIIEDYLRNNK